MKISTFTFFTFHRAVVNYPVMADHFSQGKNKIPFYKKQVVNKSARVIFLARLVILWDK